jgi:hypothetical protein
MIMRFTVWYDDVLIGAIEDEAAPRFTAAFGVIEGIMERRPAYDAIRPVFLNYAPGLSTLRIVNQRELAEREQAYKEHTARLSVRGEDGAEWLTERIDIIDFHGDAQNALVDLMRDAAAAGLAPSAKVGPASGFSHLVYVEAWLADDDGAPVGARRLRPKRFGSDGAELNE